MTDPVSRHARTRLALIAAAVLGFAATAAAQEIPEGQSCGGLVCDLGLFGYKTTPKAAAAPTVGTPVPPPAQAAAKSEPSEEVKRPAHKKPRVAKAATVKAPAARPAKTEPRATVNASVEAPVATPAPAAVAPSPVAAVLAPPPSFAEPGSIAPAAAPAPAPVPITATPEQPVVLANPYVYNKPLKFMFQSVDPTQAVQ